MNVADFKILFLKFRLGTLGTRRNSTLFRRSPSSDLNPGPPDHEAGVTTIWQLFFHTFEEKQWTGFS